MKWIFSWNGLSEWDVSNSCHECATVVVLSACFFFFFLLWNHLSRRLDISAIHKMWITEKELTKWSYSTPLTLPLILLQSCSTAHEKRWKYNRQFNPFPSTLLLYCWILFSLPSLCLYVFFFSYHFIFHFFNHIIQVAFGFVLNKRDRVICIAPLVSILL